jgi:hypothetical protein
MLNHLQKSCAFLRLCRPMCGRALPFRKIFLEFGAAPRQRGIITNAFGKIVLSEEMPRAHLRRQSRGYKISFSRILFSAFGVRLLVSIAVLSTLLIYGHHRSQAQAGGPRREAEPASSPLSAAENNSGKRGDWPLPQNNGYFVLYYGSADDEDNLNKFRQIRDTAPAFAVIGYFDQKQGTDPHGPVNEVTARRALCVMHGGSPSNCMKSANVKSTAGSVKTLYYVGVKADDDKKVSSQIQTAMDLGYDGVFLDQAESASNPNENARYNKFTDLARTWNNSGHQERLVVINPGVSDPSVCKMFDYADIVSVENEWNKHVPDCGVPIDSRRWLAVQGDASDCNRACKMSPEWIPLPCRDTCPPRAEAFSDAATRLAVFRRNGGWWYYPGGWNGDMPSHERLPSYLNGFATLAR